FYLAPIAAHDLFLPCTRCDAENGPPVRGKRRRRLALSLAFSLCPALFLCLPLPLFGFSSLLLCFSLLRCLLRFLLLLLCFPLRFLLLLFRFLLRFLLLLFLGLAQTLGRLRLLLPLRLALRLLVLTLALLGFPELLFGLLERDLQPPLRLTLLLLLALT